MQVLEPSAGEVRWVFKVVGYCAIIFAVAFAYVIVVKVNQGNDIVRIAASEADQVQRLNSQIDEQNQLSAQRSKQASRERDQAYAQITRLQRQVAASNRTTAALLRFLRANGIDVPSTIIAPSHRQRSTRPKASHRPTSRATPTPIAPTPSPDSQFCQVLPQLCGLPLSVPSLLP